MSFDSAFESISSAKEPSIETSANDRTYATVIWVVAVDGTLYVRSFLGHEARWYRRVATNPRVALTVGSDRLEFTAAREAYLVAFAERAGVTNIASFDRSIDRVPTVTRIEP